MPRFFKRPVIVTVDGGKTQLYSQMLEAAQWNGPSGWAEMPKWLQDSLARTEDKIGSVKVKTGYVAVTTHGGVESVQPGEYVVQAIDGTIFGATLTELELNHDRIVG